MAGGARPGPAAEARIADAAARLEDQSVALLNDLIAAGGRGRRAVDAIVERRMHELGCRTEVVDYVPRDVPIRAEFAAEDRNAESERVVLGRVGGAGGGPSLLLFAHPDVEPFRAEPAWRSAPFRPEIREGRLHGWGVADDLAGLVMLLQAAAVLREARLEPRGALILASTPSKAHRRGIVAAFDRGVEADAAVYLHPAESGNGLDEIKALSPGQVEFLVRIVGRAPPTSEPAHAAVAHRGINPLVKAVTIIEALARLDARRGDTVRHARLEAAAGRSANVLVSYCAAGTESGLARMPIECRLGGVASLVPGESPEDVMDAIESAIAEAAAADPWLAAAPPEVTRLSGVGAAETPPEAPIYRLVEATLRAAGAHPDVNPLHVASDIRHPMLQRGIPTVGFGPRCGGLAMAGGADEWVDVADLLRSVRATAGIAAAWCGAA